MKLLLQIIAVIMLCMLTDALFAQEGPEVIFSGRLLDDPEESPLDFINSSDRSEDVSNNSDSLDAPRVTHGGLLDNTPELMPLDPLSEFQQSDSWGFGGIFFSSSGRRLGGDVWSLQYQHQFKLNTPDQDEIGWLLALGGNLFTANIDYLNMHLAASHFWVGVGFSELIQLEDTLDSDAMVFMMVNFGKVVPIDNVDGDWNFGFQGLFRSLTWEGPGDYLPSPVLNLLFDHKIGSGQSTFSTDLMIRLAGGKVLCWSFGPHLSGEYRPDTTTRNGSRIFRVGATTEFFFPELGGGSSFVASLFWEESTLHHRNADLGCFFGFTMFFI